MCEIEFGERCFERLPDDDEECKDCDDVLVRNEKFANALTVLSRAIAAKDSRLFLDCEFSAKVFSVSQEVVKVVEALWWFVGPSGATGFTARMVGGCIWLCEG